MATSIYNRYLGKNGFRGVDFSSDPSMVADFRLSDARNVWRDYLSKQGQAIETFPGFRKAEMSTGLFCLNGAVHGIFRYRVNGTDYAIIHAGKIPYYMPLSGDNAFVICKCEREETGESEPNENVFAGKLRSTVDSVSVTSADDDKTYTVTFVDASTGETIEAKTIKTGTDITLPTSKKVIYYFAEGTTMADLRNIQEDKEVILNAIPLNVLYKPYSYGDIQQLNPTGATDDSQTKYHFESNAGRTAYGCYVNDEGKYIQFTANVAGKIGGYVVLSQGFKIVYNVYVDGRFFDVITFDATDAAISLRKVWTDGIEPGVHTVRIEFAYGEGIRPSDGASIGGTIGMNFRSIGFGEKISSNTCIVTFKGIYGATYAVQPGEKLVTIPSAPNVEDKRFVGWRIGDVIYTTEELKALEITSDITVVATYTDKYISLADNRSTGFQYGDNFYIGDGMDFYVIDKNFSMKRAYSLAYIPTTYFNGDEYEQRNLLTNQFYEEWTLDSTVAYQFGSSDLQYEITGENTCKCVGKKTFDSVLFIPYQAEIDGKMYRVTEIGSHAFHNVDYASGTTYPHLIHKIAIGNGIEKIGDYAFTDCSLATEIFIPESVKTIGKSAFIGCGKFSDESTVFCLSSGVESIGAYAFGDNKGSGETAAETTVYYDGAEEDFNKITVGENNVFGTKIFSDENGYQNRPVKPYYYGMYVHERCTKVDSVTLVSQEGIPENDRIQFEFETEKGKDGYFLKIFITSDTNLSGETVRLKGTLDEVKFSASNPDHAGFTGGDSVRGCIITSQFDGRIFFTGNPAFPNTVFYTQRDATGHNNPTYFGAYNWFDVGIGASPNTAMISTGSHLIVLKSDTVQDGAINLYAGVTQEDDILPRIYVREQGLPGTGCLGSACNFSDDPVFISVHGLDAVGTQTVNLERTIQHRSSNVDARLLNEDLSKALMTEWQGYLLILFPGGHVYMADSRSMFEHNGTVQYEWFYLDDFCTYDNDISVYADTDGHTYTDGVMQNGNGEFHVGDTEVFLTGERTGGTPHYATAIASVRDILLFGTDNGEVCIINTDKRGTKPSDTLSALYDDSDYAARYSDVIPREYYSHAGHRYVSYMALTSENAGVPHLTKSTVRKSVVLRTKFMFGSRLFYNVRTDRQSWGEILEPIVSCPDFSDFDAGLLSFATDEASIYALPEKRKRWVEKQFAFFCSEPFRPWGVYYLSYQYEIHGRVKNR